MTNLEALKAIVQYPLDNNSFKLALISRSLTEIDTYSASNLKKLELAKADCLSTILSTPTTTEGGFSLAHTNKGEVRKEMERLYSKWGESYNVSNPVIRDATNQW
jgi:hypothetical protein